MPEPGILLTTKASLKFFKVRQLEPETALFLIFQLGSAARANDGEAASKID